MLLAKMVGTHHSSPRARAAPGEGRPNATAILGTYRGFPSMERAPKSIYFGGFRGRFALLSWRSPLPRFATGRSRRPAALLPPAVPPGSTGRGLQFATSLASSFDRRPPAGVFLSAQKNS